jgi:antitoxin component YwqK of YwqJK toxin-antitoxin module
MANRFFQLNSVKRKFIVASGLVIVSGGIYNQMTKKNNLVKEINNKNVPSSKYYNYSNDKINEIIINEIIDKNNFGKEMYKEIKNNSKDKTNEIIVNNTFDSSHMYTPNIVKTYYPNKQLNESYLSIDNKKNGEYKKYYDSGKIHIICSYTNDKRNGSYKEYYKNGLILEENYINGEKIGKHKLYYIDNKN